MNLKDIKEIVLEIEANLTLHYNPPELIEKEGVLPITATNPLDKISQAQKFMKERIRDRYLDYNSFHSHKTEHYLHHTKKSFLTPSEQDQLDELILFEWQTTSPIRRRLDLLLEEVKKKPIKEENEIDAKEKLQETYFDIIKKVARNEIEFKSQEIGKVSSKINRLLNRNNLTTASNTKSQDEIEKRIESIEMGMNTVSRRIFVENDSKVLDSMAIFLYYNDSDRNNNNYSNL